MSEQLHECPFCGATRGLYTLDEYGGLCADDDLEHALWNMYVHWTDFDNA